MREQRGRSHPARVERAAIALSAIVLTMAGCGSGAHLGTIAAPTIAAPTIGASAMAASAASTAPLSTNGGGSVATYRGDSGRTGTMPGPGPMGTPRVSWRFQAGAPIGSSPAVVNGVVYLLSNDGVVHALGLDTGIERWQAKLGVGAIGSPLVADGLVIVGDSTGVIHALAATDGSTRWTMATDGPISGAAAAASDVVVVATKTGSAYALDIPTGITRWTTALGGPVGSSVAIADGMIYLGAGPTLTAVSLTDGQIRWQQLVSKVGRIGTPTAVGGLVYAATGLDGGDRSAYGVVALDASTGVQRWRFVSPTEAVVYTPAVVGGRAYIVGEDHKVTAVDAASGAEIWTSTTDQVDEAVPAIADGLVFVAGNGGAMNALDADTGAIRWNVPYRGVPYGPTVIGGYVLVGTDLGVLIAIGGSAK